MKSLKKKAPHRKRKNLKLCNKKKEEECLFRVKKKL